MGTISWWYMAADMSLWSLNVLFRLGFSTYSKFSGQPVGVVMSIVACCHILLSNGQRCIINMLVGTGHMAKIMASPKVCTLEAPQ